MKFLVFLICLLFVSVLRGQTVLERTRENSMFFYDIVNSKPPQNPDKSRLTLLLEVVYDDLQFLKSEKGYTASYEVSVAIKKNGNQVTGDLWQETVNVDTYELTNSRRNVSLTNAAFEVEPDKYDVEVYVQDEQRKEQYKAQAEVKLQDFPTDRISAGGLTFTRHVNRNPRGGVESIVPEVTTRQKGLGRNTQVYFEIYNPNRLDSVQIDYEIKGEHTDMEIKSGFPFFLSGEKDVITFPLTTDTLKHDAYMLTIRVKNEEKSFKLEKPFYIRWQGLPSNAQDLETAIQQARYAAKGDEWKKLKKAKGDEQLEAFQEFWADKDPTPGNDYNETMYNFYARVEAANRHFGVMKRDGWRTDRGMVFIILGPPDNIVSNNYPANSRPYQVWQYYSINRQFEFYDRTGFGNYEMLYPVSIHELQRYAGNQ
ncbi:MAG: GWxTD domain-containing protein [candidate division KSB1 bacterium]|nr:GWxTD domain-containing protein [candidate division KSB1 bacterium]